MYQTKISLSTLFLSQERLQSLLLPFRVFKELLVKKYGQEEANKRIYATTDRAKGAVKVEADANGWDTFCSA